MNEVITVLWPEFSGSVFEMGWSARFCLQQARRAFPAATFATRSQESDAGELSGIVVDVAEPHLFVSAAAAQRLLAAVEQSRFDVVGPVFNASATGQTFTPEGAYAGMSTFQKMAAAANGPSRVMDALDPGLRCFAPGQYVRRDHALRQGCVSDAWVHRFESFYDQERDDLVALIHPEAKSVFDVGTAHGGYARSLRRMRPELVLHGVDVSAEMAEAARPFYDAIVVADVEALEQPPQRYDVINCGDVIEHLRDPWSFFARARSWLHRGGVLIGSVPNAGHWSLVRDLLNGRFDYIPVGITCVGHLRWFTKATIEELAVESGFQLEHLERQKLPLSREGERFIDRQLAAGLGSREELETSELLFRLRTD